MTLCWNVSPFSTPQVFVYVETNKNLWWYITSIWINWNWRTLLIRLTFRVAFHLIVSSLEITNIRSVFLIHFNRVLIQRQTKSLISEGSSWLVGWLLPNKIQYSIWAVVRFTSVAWNKNKELLFSSLFVKRLSGLFKQSQTWKGLSNRKRINCYFKLYFLTWLGFWIFGRCCIWSIFLSDILIGIRSSKRTDWFTVACFVFGCVSVSYYDELVRFIRTLVAVSIFIGRFIEMWFDSWKPWRRSDLTSKPSLFNVLSNCEIYNATSQNPLWWIIRELLNKINGRDKSPRLADSVPVDSIRV